MFRGDQEDRGDWAGIRTFAQVGSSLVYTESDKDSPSDNMGGHAFVRNGTAA